MDEIRNEVLDFIEDISGLVETVENSKMDDGTLEVALIRLKRIWNLVTSVPGGQNSDVTMQVLKIISYVEDFLNDDIDVETISEAELIHPGVGRCGASYDIPEASLAYLVEEMYLTIPDIASIFKVSINTIKRRMSVLGLSIRDTYCKLDDDTLDEAIQELVSIYPNAGIRTISGLLKSKKLRVQRERIIDSLHRVNPVGMLARFRKIKETPRVAYNVSLPMALWHIDGNHKLVRYRIIIHGGIDGFSRKVMFCEASTNNEAATVLEAFCGAVDRVGGGQPPLRVRADRGGENVRVSEYMLNHPLRGPGRGSFIAGKSPHNQRIERLWRDLNTQVIRSYRQEFEGLRKEGLLNLDDDVDVWCLHHVYLPNIKAHLQSFVDGWNNHPLSTSGGRSPNQLFHTGLCKMPVQHQLAQESFMTEEEIRLYGIDWGGPVPRRDEFEEDDSKLDIPPVSVSMPDLLFRRFLQGMESVSESFPHEQYIHARQLAVKLNKPNTDAVDSDV